MKRSLVILSTDGSCYGNPGPGGYAGILRYGKVTKSVVGYNEMTTNNRMELTAVIESVKALIKPCDVTVRTDSMYIVNGVANMEENYNRGWKSKAGAKLVNSDLWQELYDAKSKGDHCFQCIHVKGHSGDEDNEACDKLAKEQVQLHTLATG